MKRELSIVLLISFYILFPILSLAEVPTHSSSTMDSIEFDSSSDIIMGSSITSSDHNNITTNSDISSQFSNTNESDTDNETLNSSDDIVKEKKEILKKTNIMAVTALTGNGTLTSPFRVYSADQLSTVATTINQSSYTTTTNSGTVYINLMSDITLTGTMITFTNSSNPIIIDGTTTQNNTGNSFIYFTGSSTSGSGLFTLNSRNMTITFKNINFGSKLSAKNNYYGFCQTTQANSTINIQNVNYYAEDGGQPFYATGNIVC